jgi:uncharacterized protein (TIGR03437 family)
MDRSRNLTLHRSLLTLCLISCTCSGQIPTLGVAGAGYTSPFPLRVAPGQLVTMYLQGPAVSNVSAAFWNQKVVEAAPVLQVSPWSTGCIAPPNSTCATGLALTVQIPFDAPASVIAVESSGIAFLVNGVQSGYFGVQAQPDRVHILTSCDTIVGGAPSCAPLITHGNGQQVSYLYPASSGEELVAYATGLGQTNPPLATGVPASQSSPAVSSFNMDFNYRPNALASQPAFTPVNPPLFAGSTQGFVGLYQINFVVPPPPAGLQPCSAPIIAAGPIGGLVLSNLTVSVGSLVSFDGAGICVTPDS